MGMILNDEVFAAAQRITSEHMRLQRAAEVKAHNAAIDKASEIIADWLANGRDETTLFDRLQDAKVWISLTVADNDRRVGKRQPLRLKEAK